MFVSLFTVLVSRSCVMLGVLMLTPGVMMFGLMMMMRRSVVMSGSSVMMLLRGMLWRLCHFGGSSGGLMEFHLNDLISRSFLPATEQSWSKKRTPALKNQAPDYYETRFLFGTRQRGICCLLALWKASPRAGMHSGTWINRRGKVLRRSWLQAFRWKPNSGMRRPCGFLPPAGGADLV
jgi:hypothetical protein